MTSRERVMSHLTDNGMFRNDAEKVMEIAIPQIEKMMPDGYQFTWDREAEGYPEAMYDLIIHVLRGVALKWIDANVPKAWYRDVFDDLFVEQFLNSQS